MTEPAPLKILPFLHSFEPGGVERVAFRLARAWAEAGAEVRIAMGRTGGALTGEAPAGVALSFAPPFGPAAHFESLWMVPHLVAMVRRHRPDVLFCAGNTYVIGAVLARLILGSACPPIVAKVSNSLARADMGWAMRTLYGLWLKLQARLIDRFVGMAETMRPEMADALGVAPEALSIIDDPALDRAGAARAAALRDAAPRAHTGRRFVAVGRLAPQKDFPLLLRAFAAIAEPHDRLTILGEGPERTRLERLAAELGIADRVALAGYATDVASALAEADVFVLSSRYEGVPAVVLEALASGVPIVATDCCVSMGELLAGGALGRLVAPSDVGALASAMVAAAGDAAPPVAAMRAMADRFTVERSASAYLTLMRTMADARAPTRLDAGAGSGRSAARA